MKTLATIALIGVALLLLAAVWLMRNATSVSKPAPMAIPPAALAQWSNATARWSNAALVAVLPQISDCAKALDLPISLPISTGEVAQFVFPIPGWGHRFEGMLRLTNGYLFYYSGGMVYSCDAADGLDAPIKKVEELKRFAGKDDMTTNEAIQLAKDTFVKLGYKLADFHVDAPPAVFDRPFRDTPQYGHLPYCRVYWVSPTSETNGFKSYSLEFDIDMNKKRIDGMTLTGNKLWRPPPRIDFTPDQNTNAPPD